MSRSSIALFAMLVGVGGCDATNVKESVRQQQAVEHLCWTENRIRNAANVDKAAFLDDLARSPCPFSDVCEMRDVCVAAYALHIDALKLTAVAKQQIVDGRDAEAAGILGAAEAKLKAAAPKIEDCTEHARTVRRAYHVD